MAVASSAPTDVDSIINRVNVALAKSQRLIASWLPPLTVEEAANAKTEEELEKEDQELFTPVPELLGLGAQLPSAAPEGSANRRELSSNEKLRQRLLGKRAASHKSARTLQGTNKVITSHQLKKNSQQPLKHGPSESEDEEEGRTSSFMAKRRRTGSTRLRGAVTHSHGDTVRERPLGTAAQREAPVPHSDTDGSRHVGQEEATADAGLGAKTVKHLGQETSSAAPRKSPPVPINHAVNNATEETSRKKRKRRRKKRHQNTEAGSN